MASVSFHSGIRTAPACIPLEITGYQGETFPKLQQGRRCRNLELGVYLLKKIVVMNLLDNFREVIDWIDCSHSTGLSSGQSSHSGLWDCSGGFSCQFGLYQKSLVRSFFLLIWHAFITNYMVVIIGASSLCRTLDSIPFKNKKNLFAAAFRYQGLALTIKPSTVIKFFKTFLLEDLSVKLTIFLFGTTL